MMVLCIAPTSYAAPIGTSGSVGCSTSSASASATATGLNAGTSASTGLAFVATFSDSHADYPAPGAAVHSTATSSKTGLWPSSARMTASNSFGTLKMGCDLPPKGTEKIQGVADQVKVACEATSADWNNWNDAAYAGSIMVAPNDALWFVGTVTTSEGTSNFAMPMTNGATFRPNMQTSTAPGNLADSGLLLDAELTHSGTTYLCNVA